MSNFYKTLFGSFFVLLLAWDANAQQSNLLRREISTKDYDFIYFIPVKSNGLITVKHGLKFRSSKDNWELDLYSKNLVHLKNYKFSTGPGHRLIEYIDDEDSLLYGFFAEENGSRKYEVIKFNYLTGTINKATSNGDNHLFYQNFDILETTQFVSGVRNPNSGAYLGQAFFSLTLIPLIWGVKIYSEPAQIFYKNLSNGKEGKLQPLPKGEDVIFATKSNPKSGGYGIIIRNNYKKKSTLHYFEYNSQGRETRHSILSRLNAKNILSGSLIITNDSTFAFVGTYNNDKNKNSRKNKVSVGIFVSTLVNGKEKVVKFHPFSEFTNAKKALDFRNLRRFEENKKKGEAINLSFNLLLHKEIIQMDSVFVLLAESYHPEYHYETYNNFYAMYNDQIFDGYRFSQAITAGFNSKGELLWDNIFKISDLISYNLNENVIVYFDGKTQVMLFYDNGKIYSKVISGNKIVYRKEESEIQTVGNKEKVLYENYSKIYHWYGPYFLLTGYQVVISNNGNKRKVFFFLKLKFG